MACRCAHEVLMKSLPLGAELRAAALFDGDGPLKVSAL